MNNPTALDWNTGTTREQPEDDVRCERIYAMLAEQDLIDKRKHVGKIIGECRGHQTGKLPSQDYMQRKTNRILKEVAGGNNPA